MYETRTRDGCRGIQLCMRNQRTDPSQESFVVVMWRGKSQFLECCLQNFIIKLCFCHIPTQLIQSYNASWEDGGKAAFMWLDYCRAVQEWVGYEEYIVGETGKSKGE